MATKIAFWLTVHVGYESATIHLFYLWSEAEEAALIWDMLLLRQRGKIKAKNVKGTIKLLLKMAHLTPAHIPLVEESCIVYPVSMRWRSIILPQRKEEQMLSVMLCFTVHPLSMNIHFPSFYFTHTKTLFFSLRQSV